MRKYTGIDKHMYLGFFLIPGVPVAVVVEGVLLDPLDDHVKLIANALPILRAADDLDQVRILLQGERGAGLYLSVSKQETRRRVPKNLRGQGPPSSRQ